MFSASSYEQFMHIGRTELDRRLDELARTYSVSDTFAGLLADAQQRTVTMKHDCHERRLLGLELELRGGSVFWS